MPKRNARRDAMKRRWEEANAAGKSNLADEHAAVGPVSADSDYEEQPADAAMPTLERSDAEEDDDLVNETDGRRRLAGDDSPGAAARRAAEREWQARSRRRAAAGGSSSSLASFFAPLAKSKQVEPAPVAMGVPIFADGSSAAVGTRVEGAGERAGGASAGALAGEEGAVKQQPGYSASGKRLGRPPKRASDDGGLALDQRYASHGGVAPHGGVAGNAHSSKAARRDARQSRAAQANPPPTPAPQRSDAGVARGPQLLPRLAETHPTLCASLKRISAQRCFQRADLEGGEGLAKAEWTLVRKDPYELRKVYSMAHFLVLREQGHQVEAALQLAASGVLLGVQRKPLTPQTLRLWLQAYVSADGRIRPSQRGRHVSTESFLIDPDIKDQARRWLRQNVRAAQPTKSQEPPLSVARFHAWCNDVLLVQKLKAPGRQPINFRTAVRWLHALGFSYREHRKTMYVDGHERRDVVVDRAEKLVMLQVLREVLVTFEGDHCEKVVWPDTLQPGEPPVVLVSQDESAFHTNDDIDREWCEEGVMSLKQKSRGGLLMVSEFLSELKGRLRCTQAEAEAYAADFPQSLIAGLLAKSRAQPDSAKPWACDCRLILEPGSAPGKDNWFDAVQLHEQTRLALEVFEASHFAPARDVVVPAAVVVSFELGLVSSPAEERPVRLRVGVRRSSTVVHLPRVRCKPLVFYDHSSGHASRGADSRSAATMPKGPDWTGKHPWMRDGWYVDSLGRRVTQPMQFAEGDVLPCDVTVPSGIDVTASPGAAATAPPRVLPEQLDGRRVCEETCDGPVVADISLSEDPEAPLTLTFDHDELEPVDVTVEHALRHLVGEPPQPEEHQEAAPSAEETEAAIKEFFASRRQTIVKHHPPTDPTETKDAKTARLLQIARSEWPGLKSDRQLHFVQKARAKAAGSSAPPPRQLLRQGEPVPQLLVGRLKGMEVVLAERGVLPSGSLRAVCPTEADHGTLPPGGLPVAMLPPLGSAGYARRHSELLDNCCCCKRLLSIQPDFKEEVSQLERLFQTRQTCVVGADTVQIGAPDERPTQVPRAFCMFLPKFHCELNWIERYWGATKQYLRKHCTYSLPGLRAALPIALSQEEDELPDDLADDPELPVSPIFKQRRWARTSWRYMREYRKRVAGNDAVRAVATQSWKCHRDMSNPRARRAEAAMAAEAAQAL